MADDPVADVFRRLDRPVQAPVGLEQQVLLSVLAGEQRRGGVVAARRRSTVFMVAVAAALAVVVIAATLRSPHATGRVTTSPAAPGIDTTLPVSGGVAPTTSHGPSPVGIAPGTTHRPSSVGAGDVHRGDGAGRESAHSGALPSSAKRLVYAKRNAAGDHDIWVMDLATKREAQLTSDATDDIEPSWSPDGRQIAFAKSGEIYMMRADGSDLKLVAGKQSNTSSGSPEWSPRGDVLMFGSGSPGGVGSCPRVHCTGIYQVGLSGADPPRLVASYGDSATWTPDGGHIVYSDPNGPSCANGYQNACDGTLFFADADGGHRRSLGLTGAWPKVSPDGERIAYQVASKAGNDADVRVAWITASGTVRDDSAVLAGGIADSTHPAWSADGDGLFYEVDADQGNFEPLGIYACDSWTTCNSWAGGNTLVVAGGQFPSASTV